MQSVVKHEHSLINCDNKANFICVVVTKNGDINYMQRLRQLYQYQLRTTNREDCLVIIKWVIIPAVTCLLPIYYWKSMLVSWQFSPKRQMCGNTFPWRRRWRRSLASAKAWDRNCVKVSWTLHLNCLWELFTTTESTEIPLSSVNSASEIEWRSGFKIIITCSIVYLVGTNSRHRNCFAFKIISFL